jgi:hypothetical protein
MPQKRSGFLFLPNTGIKTPGELVTRIHRNNVLNLSATNNNYFSRYRFIANVPSGTGTGIAMFLPLSRMKIANI